MGKTVKFDPWDNNKPKKPRNGRNKSSDFDNRGGNAGKKKRDNWKRELKNLY